MGPRAQRLDWDVPGKKVKGPGLNLPGSSCRLPVLAKTDIYAPAWPAGHGVSLERGGQFHLQVLGIQGHS